MEKLQFKCTLLSDVILSASPATQGGGRTLDFIPGNVFLGIAASSLYDKEDGHTWLLFHSSQVRFGDANPSLPGRRGLHIPAALYYPKLESITSNCYVRYKTPETEQIKDMQLKQCRSGYYVFDDSGEPTAFPVKVDRGVAIKSAYDAELRRSRDEQMFTYQSLRKGLLMYFEVELDDEAKSLKAELVDSLCGERHVGRSRSAEYGLVRIEEAKFSEPATHQGNYGEEREVAVYADSRLIFLDEYGRPKFQPTAKDLGFIDKEDCAETSQICWDKSQIRPFQFAPWNYKRQAFGNDRCGIEKGSVIIVKTRAAVPADGYVGSYRNEGFGKVLYDPSFLGAMDDGHSRYKFAGSLDAESEQAAGNSTKITENDSPLLKYLTAGSASAVNSSDILRAVNIYARDNKDIFRHGGESFASQWGSIRSLAMVISDSDGLYAAVAKYLTHGVAKDKWEDRGRWKSLDDFMTQSGRPRDNLQELLINLSSEMAKICSNKE